MFCLTHLPSLERFRVLPIFYIVDKKQTLKKKNVEGFKLPKGDKGNQNGQRKKKDNDDKSLKETNYPDSPNFVFTDISMQIFPIQTMNVD